MKFLKLNLENWRGVEACEVRFADGVTLIEGPNEAGKSTIVNAIQMLFNVLDSSTRGDVKAIQPVGQDVGSSVSLEARVGDYHFVYSKTYNKNKQTELHVLEPRAEQLTGREAHERVEQMLEETVDMALWNALLVTQGSEIEGPSLSRSDGLARALDAAAGGESPDQDDSDLFARAQVEYEQYFTLKRGEPKHAALENQVNGARAAVAAASAAMLEIETDSAAHERVLAEIGRLEIELPELQQEERAHEATWQAVGRIREQLAAKERERAAATELSRAVREEVERRQQLLAGLAADRKQLESARLALAPEAQQLGVLEASTAAAKGAFDAARAEQKNARSMAERARLDAQHLENAERLAAARTKLTQLQQYSVNLTACRASLKGIRIDGDGLEAVRGAEGDVQMAKARLDTAASSVEITADDRLKLRVDDEDLVLEAGAKQQRTIASETLVALPGVLSIRITPSQSANDLEAELEERLEIFARTLETYAVADLADAVATEAKRAADERDAASWSEKIEALLDAENAEDLDVLSARVADLDLRCSDYLAQRPEAPVLPLDLADARGVLATAEKALADCEQRVEALQAAWEQARDQQAEASAQHSLARQEMAGLEKIIEQREQDLARSQATEEDEALERRAEEKSMVVESYATELAGLNAQLESASPEAAEALYANAQAACERANKDLSLQRTELAILKDRLTKAQADGRFETLEAAEQELAALDAVFQATSARAAAVARLWEVLNRHRDEARRAYVRPLKEGVEQLGRIVFGADFTIELGDGWEMLSCTRDGKTIPFGDLSIGAQEQLGILMRLAAARIVSSQGGVPLIIDDALGFSDPSRLKTMGAAIASAGRDCQVILLTCTPGRFTHVGNAEIVRF